MVFLFVTVDGNQKSGEPTSWGKGSWNLPLDTRFLHHGRWCRISEPSTLLRVIVFFKVVNYLIWNSLGEKRDIRNSNIISHNMSSPKTTPNNKKVRKMPWPRKRGGKIDLLLKNTKSIWMVTSLWVQIWWPYDTCSQGGFTLSFPIDRDWKMILKSKPLEFAKTWQPWQPLFGPLFWQIQPDIVPRLVRLKCDEEIVLFTKGPKNDSASC